MSEAPKYTTLPDGRIYRWLRVAPGPKGRKAVKGHSPEEVEEKAAAILAALKKKPTTTTGQTPSKEILPGTLADFYYKTYFPRVSRDATETTKTMYRSLFRKHILPALGARPIAEIGYDEIEGMLAAVKRRDKRNKDGKPLSAKTKREILLRAKELMGLYVQIERGKGNSPREDWRLVKPPKAPAKKAREEVEDDYTVRLLEGAAGTWLEGPLFCILFLALRRGEVAGLSVKSLDRKNLRIRVLEQRNNVLPSGALPKGGKTRDIPVPAKLMDTIDRLRSKSSTWLWLRDGKPINPDHLTDQIPSLCLRLGVARKTPHELRALAASNLVAMGADLTMVMEILGHSALDTSLIYFDPKASHKRAILSRLLDGDAPKDDAA